MSWNTKIENLLNDEMDNFIELKRKFAFEGGFYYFCDGLCYILVSIGGLLIGATSSLGIPLIFQTYMGFLIPVITTIQNGMNWQKKSILYQNAGTSFDNLIDKINQELVKDPTTRQNASSFLEYILTAKSKILATVSYNNISNHKSTSKSALEEVKVAQTLPIVPAASIISNPPIQLPQLIANLPSEKPDTHSTKIISSSSVALHELSKSVVSTDSPVSKNIVTYN